jgi:uncharacterized protein YyaL (SSP411 family)
MFSHALLATDLRLRGTTEVVIVGDDMTEFVQIAQSIWRPDAVLAWGEPYDSPLWESRPAGHAYVCRDHVCAAPASTTEEFVTALTGRAPVDPEADPGTQAETND